MKKQFKAHSILSCLVLILLSAAMALSVIACKKEEVEAPQVSDTGEVLGVGQTQFAVEVTHLDGTVKSFTVNTDKKTVGEALTEVGLIEGEDSQYGLMISAVDGKTHTYEDGGKYWAFYINGEYAMSGVDSTDVTAGATYSFKVE
ncbi:MAG: DUF4430 domain-containing protein [Ruminococcaceae bacterium]|nr:DUF4430 domain-containing protein [Oscillospiraceae bacterium]